MRKTLVLLAVTQLLFCAPVLAQEKSLLYGNVEVQDNQPAEMDIGSKNRNTSPNQFS